MDLTNLTAKVKVFQRRTTQKVLQQMGIADKTEDDSPAFQNFLALGSFANQLKTTVQATNFGFEKACSAQTHLASQVQAYLNSELSGDGEVPPGELNDFFSGNDAHSAILEAIAAKFCDASTEIGHHALIQVVGQLDDLVLKPIQKDEEFGVITKDLIEEKKRATLDFDSYRRVAQSATSPMEHDKAEAKARAAKEKYDDINRRVAEHIDQRNRIRCKLLVHGILTSIQQYCNFYAHAVDILRDTANSLKPLLDVYQMNETQLQSTVNLGNQPTSRGQGGQDSRAKSPPQGKFTADSLFTDYEGQNRGKPAPPRSGAVSPHIDNMMRDNLNLKKPAAPSTQQPQRSVPMNQLNNNNPNVGTRTPPPTHHVNTSVSQNNSPNPTPPSQPAPQPFDFFSGDFSTSGSQSQPQPKNPQEDFLVNVNMDQTTPVKSGGGGGGLFGDNLMDSGSYTRTTMPTAPAMQPTNVDVFDIFSTGPSKKVSLEDEFDILTPKSNNGAQNKERANNNNNNKSNNNTTQQQKGGDPFDLFGGPPQPKSGSGPTPNPTPVTAAPDKQTQRTELNPAVTQRISNWAERGGRKANLRALLSTLHEVIWVDSGWDAMSLGELITPVQVKKAYHRANIIVHPDKVQNGTVEQQLIAQRIFEALRVSYETFKDEPK